MNYPTIISLPDGTDIIIEPCNIPLKITIFTHPNSLEENEEADKLKKSSKMKQLEDIFS